MPDRFTLPNRRPLAPQPNQPLIDMMVPEPRRELGPGISLPLDVNAGAQAPPPTMAGLQEAMPLSAVAGGVDRPQLQAQPTSIPDELMSPIAENRKPRGLTGKIIDMILPMALSGARGAGTGSQIADPFAGFSTAFDMEQERQRQDMMMPFEMERERIKNQREMLGIDSDLAKIDESRAKTRKTDEETKYVGAEADAGIGLKEAQSMKAIYDAKLAEARKLTEEATRGAKGEQAGWAARLTEQQYVERLAENETRKELRRLYPGLDADMAMAEIHRMNSQASAATTNAETGRMNANTAASIAQMRQNLAKLQQSGQLSPYQAASLEIQLLKAQNGGPIDDLALMMSMPEDYTPEDLAARKAEMQQQSAAPYGALRDRIAPWLPAAPGGAATPPFVPGGVGGVGGQGGIPGVDPKRIFDFLPPRRQ